MNRFKIYIDRARSRGIARGPDLVVYASIDTTMRVAAEMVRDGRKDGTLIVALHQTAGRGSGNRVWHSGAGNLMFSRIVEVKAHEAGQEMEMIAACAIGEIMRKLLPRNNVTIKYPNDVLIDGEKICGCLVEPKDDLEGSTTRKVVLGVGVNLKLAPQLTGGKASTSLKAHGCDVGIADMLAMFNEKFADILGFYRQSGHFNAVLERMGFLDHDGCITLTCNGTQQAVRGAYAGFSVHVVGKEPLAFLRLRTGEETGFLPVRQYHMINTPLRAVPRVHPFLRSLHA